MSSTQHGPDPHSVESRVVAALKTVFPPEIPIDVYELGLIYRLDVTAGGEVRIRMTLPAPECPATLPGEVQSRIESVPGVTSTVVELVWDPPWDASMMSESARLELGMF